MELVPIMDIALTVIGFLIVWVLKGMKEEMTEIKLYVKELSHSLMEIDKRVVRLEARQSIGEDK